MIHLDTSALIDSLSGPCRSAPQLRSWIESGERIEISTLVLYEWLRGGRLAEEIEAQEALFPAVTAVQFGPDEATLAAALYTDVRRPRGRELDLAIAACAIAHRASFWTLNAADFRDIPGLRLV